MTDARVILRDGERWVRVTDVVRWLRVRADQADEHVGQALHDAADVIDRDTMLR